MPAVLVSSETLLFIKVVFLSELFLRFVVFLQNASSEEHVPLSRIRDDTKGWGKHGVGLAGTARAWCVALG